MNFTAEKLLVRAISGIFYRVLFRNHYSFSLHLENVSSKLTKILGIGRTKGWCCTRHRLLSWAGRWCNHMVVTGKRVEALKNGAKYLKQLDSFAFIL